MGQSEAVFRLAYDGEAVRDGEMDVADLAPALLGLGQTVKAAAQLIEGDHADVSIRVKAHREGSFEILLSVVMNSANDFWTSLKPILKSDDVQAAATLVSLLGFSGIGASIGVVKFVRWIAGRTPEKVERTPDKTVVVTIDNVTIEVDAIVYDLTFNQNVRAGLEKVVAEPLDKDGIDVVRFGEKSFGEEIPKQESFSFRAPLLQNGDEFINRHQRPFSIVTLSFKPGQKWKLSDGHGASRSVTMSDKAFAEKVDRSEVRFAKGDILICDVIERSRRTSSGFKSDYEIVKVIEHRPAPMQPHMF